MDKMQETIADGQIHALSEKYAYILRFFPENPLMAENLSQISHLQLEFISKYAQYLLNFDQQTVLRILIKHLLSSPLGQTDENHQFIYRPAHMISILAQNSSLALKFRRVDQDNLDAIKQQNVFTDLNQPSEKENEPKI